MFWNQFFKISLAVLTAGSVASWQIWEKLATLWTIIACVSQVAIIVYEFLPFKSRLRDIKTLDTLLWSIALGADNHLFDVERGDLSDGQINDLITEYRKLWKMAEDKFFKDDCVPDNEKLKEDAKEKARIYMQRFVKEDH